MAAKTSITRINAAEPLNRLIRLDRLEFANCWTFILQPCGPIGFITSPGKSLAARQRLIKVIPQLRPGVPAQCHSLSCAICVLLIPICARRSK